MNREVFWLNDPSQFMTAQSWTRFVPMDWMTVPEALNAVLRFTIYFAVILAMVSGRGEYLLSIPVVAAVTIVLAKMYPETQTFKETFSNGGRTTPTPSNPFMNVTLDEYTRDPERPRAANVQKIDVAENMENAFGRTSELYMDTSDRFDLMQASRNFYTTAATTIPNDLDGYQRFLNKDNVSRKLDSERYVAAKGSVTIPRQEN